ncbi:MAG: hypothetical protein ACRD98_03180 [Nitrososphaera sp.]
MDELEEEDSDSGMYLNEEDIKIICNALATYKPKKDEEHLRSILLEQFEEIIPLPRLSLASACIGQGWVCIAGFLPKTKKANAHKTTTRNGKN